MINDDDDDDDDDGNHLIKTNLHFAGKGDDEMASAMIFGINQEYIHTYLSRVARA
jgi:hypothetical protein